MELALCSPIYTSVHRDNSGIYNKSVCLLYWIGLCRTIKDLPSVHDFSSDLYQYTFIYRLVLFADAIVIPFCFCSSSPSSPSWLSESYTLSSARCRLTWLLLGDVCLLHCPFLSFLRWRSLTKGHSPLLCTKVIAFFDDAKE